MINALEMDRVPWDAEPHESHDMGEWESTIVACASNDRFGQIRKCKKCKAEEVKAGGPGSHYFETELCIECSEDPFMGLPGNPHE